MDTNFVYGSGLIDAYKLEHEHAIYPESSVSSHSSTLEDSCRATAICRNPSMVDNFLTRTGMVSTSSITYSTTGSAGATQRCRRGKDWVHRSSPSGINELEIEDAEYGTAYRP